MAQLSSALWVPGFFPLITLLPLSYPDGLLPGRVWRALQVASVVGICLFTVGVAVHPEPVDGQVRLEKLFVAPAVPSALLPVTLPLILVGVVGGLAALVVRLRRSSGLQRRQVVVLLAAVALLALDVALQGVLPSPVDVLSQAVAVALVPVAIGIAVTRHRLYDLDLAVCRALAGEPRRLPGRGLPHRLRGPPRRARRPHRRRQRLAAALTGLLVLPLGTRLSRGVDRLFYGDRADRYLVLSAFSARCASGWTSPRCRRPSATRSSPLCGWARPSWSSTRAHDDGGHAGPRTEVPLRHRGRRPGLGHGHAPAGRAGAGRAGRRAGGRPRRLGRTGDRRPPAHRLAAAGAGNRWWPPARRSDAGCAATSTTASVRRWPGSGCSWTPPATWSTTRWRPS